MASELFEKGIQLRREVLGAEYVDKSMQNIDEFSMAMQEYATETAWGMIWSRPGLPRKTRSLLNIGLLAAGEGSAGNSRVEGGLGGKVYAVHFPGQDVGAEGWVGQRHLADLDLGLQHDYRSFARRTPVNCQR